MVNHIVTRSFPGCDARREAPSQRAERMRRQVADHLIGDNCENDSFTRSIAGDQRWPPCVISRTRSRSATLMGASLQTWHIGEASGSNSATWMGRESGKVPQFRPPTLLLGNRHHTKREATAIVISMTFFMACSLEIISWSLQSRPEKYVLMLSLNVRFATSRKIKPASAITPASMSGKMRVRGA